MTTIKYHTQLIKELLQHDIDLQASSLGDALEAYKIMSSKSISESKVLAFLANASEYATCVIAESDYASCAILENIMTFGTIQAKFCAVANENVTEKALLLAMNDTSVELKIAAITSPSATAKVYKKCLDTSSDLLKRKIVKHGCCPAELLTLACGARNLNIQTIARKQLGKSNQFMSIEN